MAGTRQPQLRERRGWKLTNLTVLRELELTPGTHVGGWAKSAGQRVFVLGVPAMMSGRVVGVDRISATPWTLHGALFSQVSGQSDKTDSFGSGYTHGRNSLSRMRHAVNRKEGISRPHVNQRKNVSFVSSFGGWVAMRSGACSRTSTFAQGRPCGSRLSSERGCAVPRGFGRRVRWRDRRAGR